MASLNSILADEMRARAITLARWDETMRQKAIKQLKALERDIVSRMMDLDEFGELTAAGRSRLEAIITWTRSTIANAYKGINEASVQQLIDLARSEVRFIEKTMNQALKVQLLDTAVTPAGLAEIVSNTMVRGNPMEDWWAGQASDLGRRFAGEMRMGILAGENLGQLVQRVRGTNENGFSDGIMATATRSAQALVRTAVQSVSNNTRMKIYKANDDVVGMLQHVSTLDDRTTDICKVRDGLKWKLDGEPVGHNQSFQQPPLHWNCRSTLVPVTKTWREMGFDADELSPAQRASMDGEVPADTTYEEWLKGKPVEFQERVLGVEKSQMWRDGEITFKDLVDQTGRPLTLEELQDIVTARDFAAQEPLFEGAPAEAEPEPEDFKYLTPDGQYHEDDNGDPYTLLDYTGPSFKEVKASYAKAASEQEKWVQKQPAAIRSEIIEGTSWYVSTGYHAINKSLRDGQYSDKRQSDLEEAIRGLFLASRPTKEDLVVWRGLPNPRRVEGLKPGDQITLKGMVSTSQDIDTARGFAKDSSPTSDHISGTLWEIEMPKGTHALNAVNPLETEWILPHGTKLEILNVIEDAKVNQPSPVGYRYVVKARVIETPKEPPPIKDWEPTPFVVTQKTGEPTP